MQLHVQHLQLLGVVYFPGIFAAAFVLPIIRVLPWVIFYSLWLRISVWRFCGRGRVNEQKVRSYGLGRINGLGVMHASSCLRINRPDWFKAGSKSTSFEEKTDLVATSYAGFLKARRGKTNRGDLNGRECFCVEPPETRWLVEIKAFHKGNASGRQREEGIPGREGES